MKRADYKLALLHVVHLAELSPSAPVLQKTLWDCSFTELYFIDY